MQRVIIRKLLCAVVFALLSACLSQRASADLKTQYWNLSTGSSIAYLKVPAKNGVTNTPILFLHGGPGAYVVTLAPTVDVVSKLASDGHDVYFYDQIGGGLSERLSDITEYNVERQINDVEAIRREIEAEKIILLGSSWGATLGARYAVRYPNRVEKLIFSGPGVIHPADWPDGYGRVEDRFSAEEKDRFEAAVNWPKLESALEIWASDPNAAREFLPDAEADAFFDKITNEFYMPHLGCDGRNFDIASKGYGFWSNRMTGRDLNASPDPKPALAHLSTPVLILRGECEYMNRAVAEQYHDIFANSFFVEISGAGHMIMWENPEAFLTAVRSFLSH